MVNANGHAALCDFGLSRLRLLVQDAQVPHSSVGISPMGGWASTGLTSPRSGTTRYLAPEQFLAEEATAATTESDGYTFACTIAEAGSHQATRWAVRSDCIPP